VRRVAAIKPEFGRVFPRHAIDRVGVRASVLAVLLQGSEQGPVDVGRVSRGLQIGAQPRRRLRVDRQRVPTAALA
jgi:hypothetical protein